VHVGELVLSALTIVVVVGGVVQRWLCGLRCNWGAHEGHQEQSCSSSNANTHMDIIEGGGIRPSSMNSLQMSQHRAQSHDRRSQVQHSIVEVGSCASPIDWMLAIATMRNAWYWILVPALIQAECSIPAILLGGGLGFMLLVRVVLVLILGLDIVSIVGQQSVGASGLTQDDKSNSTGCTE